MRRTQSVVGLNPTHGSQVFHQLVWVYIFALLFSHVLYMYNFVTLRHVAETEKNKTGRFKHTVAGPIMTTPRAFAFLMSFFVLFSGMPSAMMVTVRNYMTYNRGKIKVDKEAVSFFNCKRIADYQAGALPCRHMPRAVNNIV